MTPQGLQKLDHSHPMGGFPSNWKCGASGRKGMEGSFETIGMMPKKFGRPWNKTFCPLSVACSGMMRIRSFQERKAMLQMNGAWKNPNWKVFRGETRFANPQSQPRGLHPCFRCLHWTLMGLPKEILGLLVMEESVETCNEHKLIIK